MEQDRGEVKQGARTDINGTGDWPQRDRTGPDRTRQDWTGPDRTGTGEDRTGYDKTGHD